KDVGLLWRRHPGLVRETDGARPELGRGDGVVCADGGSSNGEHDGWEVQSHDRPPQELRPRGSKGGIPHGTPRPIARAVVLRDRVAEVLRRDAADDSRPAAGQTGLQPPAYRISVNRTQR